MPEAEEISTSTGFQGPAKQEPQEEFSAGIAKAEKNMARCGAEINNNDPPQLKS